MSKETQVRPDHYGGEADPFEPRKVIRAWGLNFNLGNVLKYLRRSTTQFKTVPPGSCFAGGDPRNLTGTHV